MKIEKIKYSQLFSFGNFQNETIGYEAVLEKGDKPIEEMQALKLMAKEQFELNRYNEEKLRPAQWRFNHLEEKVKELNAKFQTIQAVLSDTEISIKPLADLAEKIVDAEYEIEASKQELKTLASGKLILPEGQKTLEP